MPTPQNTPLSVTLSDAQTTLLTHAVGAAKLFGDHIPAIARAVLINAQVGARLDPYAAAHALQWAEDYQARMHPPL